MNLIITKKLLKDNNACQEGIKFFKNNFPKKLFPDGLDLSKIRIKGDYRYYFEWLNNLPTLEYDNGKVIKKTFPDGNYKTYEYDALGNCIKRIFSNGNYKTYKYDALGNCIKETFSDKRFNRYEYDALGNCIKRILSDGSSYHYEYDKLGNCIKRIFSDEDYIIHEFDERGNCVKEILSDGSVIVYEFKHDELGRLIQADNCYITYL